jgi:hypothetical protein
VTQIDLSKPIGQDRERVGFQPHWRTIFIYKCAAGHIVRMMANAFKGRTPVPGVGAITCPQCEFHAKYPK